MGPRFKQLLAEIFDDKQMSEDFSLYVHRPTATDKSFAPEGCESFYVLCPVPNLQGNVDWSSEGEVLRDRIIEALQETILPDLSSVIEEVFWMTPEDFAKDYRSMHGAGFSIEPRLTQSAWVSLSQPRQRSVQPVFCWRGHPSGRRSSRRCQLRQSG